MATHFRDDTDNFDPFVSTDPDPFANPSPDLYNPQPYGEPLRRKRRKWPIVLALLLVAALACGGVLAFGMLRSVREVKSNAQTAMGFASSFLEAAKTGDEELLQQSARGVSDYTHAVRDEMQSPQWKLATKIPVYGSDVQSLQTLGNVLVDVADNALMPLAQSSGGLNLTNLMSDGAINVSVLQDLIAAINQAGPVITRSADTIAQLPPAHLEQVSSALQMVDERLSSASDALTHVSPLLPYLPDLLGANGQAKKYLVLAQNNAEVHATGGFVGTVGYCNVIDGHIDMDDFAGINEALYGYAVSAGATPEEIAIFGERIDTHHGDHNLTPDFPRVGQMYYQLNRTLKGEEVDGVLAFDPVFLQRLLGLVGGVDTSYGVTVDGSNAASVMLNKCLFWWKPVVCDGFYTEVASLSLNKILSSLGSVDTAEFLQTVVESAAEGRCVAWLVNGDAEQAILQTGFGWELSSDETKPITGIYIDDNSGSKSAYYLSLDTTVGEAQQREDGTVAYPVNATFRHNMDRSLLWGYIPTYLTVNTNRDTYYNRNECDLYEEVYFSAPAGGHLEGFSVLRADSSRQPNGEFDITPVTPYMNLEFWHGLMRIEPGETVSVSYTVVVPATATEPLAIRTTPLIPPDIAHWNE